MNKRQIKNQIAEVYGFNVKKIALLESYETGGEVVSVRFEVCDVEYSTDFEYLEILNQ